MKLNKKHLPFYAAVVQTIQYAFGGFLYFSWIGIFVVGSMGALISFTTAYASSQINTIAKGRKLSSWIAMIGIMTLSPVIIGTSIYYGLDVIQNPIWRGIVAAVWGILPDGATALAGFISGRGLVENESKPAKSGKQSGSRGKQSAARKSRSKKMTEQIECKWQCGKSGTLASMNAHSRFCEKNPARQFEKAAQMKEREQ